MGSSARCSGSRTRCGWRENSCTVRCCCYLSIRSSRPTCGGRSAAARRGGAGGKPARAPGALGGGIGRGEAGVAWVKAVDDPRRFGVAEVGEGGWVRRLVEKPADRKNNLVVVGCYFLPEGEDLAQAIEEQMKRNLHLNGEFFLVEALNLMLERGLKMRVEPVEVGEDCGNPEALLHTNRYLLDHGRENSASASAARPGVVVVPPVFVDPAARVERAVIGPYASLAGGCGVGDSVGGGSVWV